VNYWSWFIHWLGERSTLKLLFIVNLLGTIYGYYWYKQQLLETPLYWWPFVPDSPTASLFFCFVLLAYLLGRKWPLLEAFAGVTLFKYGIWATVMIIWTGLLGGELYWEHYMLIFSHLGMAVQALLFIPYYTFKAYHLGVVAIWTLSNDVLDYTVGIFPWLHYYLHPFLPTIYVSTVILSIISISIYYFTVIKKKIFT